MLKVIEKDLNIKETEETRRVKRLLGQAYDYDKKIGQLTRLRPQRGAEKLRLIREIKDINN